MYYFLSKLQYVMDIDNSLKIVDIVIRLYQSIDICFYYQSIHNTLNTIHSSTIKCFGRLFWPSSGRILIVPYDDGNML